LKLERDIDLSFVGKTAYKIRKVFVENLKSRYGNKFVFNDDIYFGEVSKLYNRSKIVPSHSVANEITMRMFEATACGALLITKYVPHLDEFWRIGKEIVAYQDENEMYDLIDYYLNSNSEREVIARAGQKRTLTEHTYYHRAKIIEKYIIANTKSNKSNY